MIQQEAMIEKVRVLCERDERVVAALMYGSFALGEGDRFSDIEFYLFFWDETLDEVDEEGWVTQLTPVELYYVNEFGNGTAIFENLIRGEFHFVSLRKGLERRSSRRVAVRLVPVARIGGARGQRG